MEIPYCIVKGKSRLGSILHKKTASVLCLTTVKNEDKLEFSKILEAIRANFNDKYDECRKKWGGGILVSKSQAKTKGEGKTSSKGSCSEDDLGVLFILGDLLCHCVFFSLLVLLVKLLFSFVLHFVTL